MAGAEEFEILIKMNRLGPLIPPETNPPVKFRSVFYDPNLVDEDVARLANEVDDSDLESESDIEQIQAGHAFFKDPLCPPDLQQTNEEKVDYSSSPVKLGRNMRASNGKHQNKNVCDLMNERKRLLTQLKEQQAAHEKEMVSEQAATVLVNDLIQSGFHITPPETTPRPPQLQSPPPVYTSTSDEDTQIGPVEEQKFVVAIHHELKSLQ